MFGKGMRSPQGMTIVAAAGTYKPENLPQSDDRIELIWRGWRQRKYACGHEGPRSYQIHLYGVDSKKTSNWDTCPSCHIAMLKREVIRCAACGLPIFPGDGVSLYSRESKGLDLSIATLVGESVIGCMRWDCCPSGGFFAGHWSEHGFKSLYGGSSAAEHCLGM